MKVGIIVHSHTGNTLAVANKLMEQFLKAGHSVNIEQVIAVSEGPTVSKSIQLMTIPNTSGYDILIFGAPVQAFSLSSVMIAYLSQVSSLQGKKVGCFITQFFPFSWMGGNRAIVQMKKVCESKGGTVFETGIVNWSHRQRERKITTVIEKMSRFF